MSGISISARAKLNLSLDVLGKRPDGYHELRMIMQSAELCDRVYVELREPGVFLVRTDRYYIPSDERNIAIKAARAFFDATGINGGVFISITKIIPTCAGLGGGSADAAAVLRALDYLCGTNLSTEKLAEIGLRVGSDVPFCVYGGTMLAEGVGERLTELPPMPCLPVVICTPRFTCSTPALFARLGQRVSRCRPDTQGMLSALSESDVGSVARRMYNVFEDVLDKRSARTVSEIKCRLLDSGALGACMTGTGSAVFGLFSDEEAARRAVTALSGVCREVFLTRLAGGEKEKIENK